MDTTKNVPILLWSEGALVVAVCAIIPKCRYRARTRDAAIAGLLTTIARRLEAQREEGWSLPATYEVAHVPTRSALPVTPFALTPWGAPAEGTSASSTSTLESKEERAVTSTQKG